MPFVTVSILDDVDIPHGSAIVNTVRQYDMKFGVIVLTTIISVTATVIDTLYEVGAYSVYKRKKKMK